MSGILSKSSATIYFYNRHSTRETAHGTPSGRGKIPTFQFEEDRYR